MQSYLILNIVIVYEILKIFSLYHRFDFKIFHYELTINYGRQLSFYSIFLSGFLSNDYYKIKSALIIIRKKKTNQNCYLVNLFDKFVKFIHLNRSEYFYPN